MQKQIWFKPNPLKTDGRPNDKVIWFRRKTYGWGWTPCTWQGWFILAVYVAIIVRIFRGIDAQSHSGSDTLYVFLVPCIISTIVLIIICRIFGEKPRWQWGRPKSKSLTPNP